MGDYHDYIAKRVTEHAETLGRSIDYIEVGTFFGDSALAALDTGKVRRAVLVDNFKLVFQAWKSSKQTVETILARFSGIFEIMEGQSEDILPTLKETFDVGFVDGDHNAEPVARDMKNMLPLLNSGGIMFAHDTNNPDHPWLKGVVQSFADAKGLKVTFHDQLHCGLGELAI